MPIFHSLPGVVPLCCPERGSGDLVPLLLIVMVLLAGPVVFQKFKRRKGKPEMKNFKNLAIVALVGVAIGAVLWVKHNQTVPTEVPSVLTDDTAEAPADAGQVEAPAALPRLLDLGADKCVPCKMMAPILDEIKIAYAGQLQVEFIDVWKTPDAGKPYTIRSIPTQIFYDASGQELFRHEGFFAKEDILATWKELGVALKVPTPQLL